MDAVFVGDSWGDDTWNGHKTWPTLVAEYSGWRHVNLSKAGFCVDDCLSSIDDRRVVSDHDTKWIIHAGGNDLLYWVLKNPLSVLLDTYSDDKPRFTKQARDIARGVSNIVERAMSSGSSDIVVCSNNACYDLPLCRLIGFFYAPFSARKHMKQIATKVNGELLRAMSRYPGVTVYDEYKILSKLSWKWDCYHPTEGGHATLAAQFCVNVNHKTYA